MGRAVVAGPGLLLHTRESRRALMRAAACRALRYKRIEGARPSVKIGAVPTFGPARAPPAHAARPARAKPEWQD